MKRFFTFVSGLMLTAQGQASDLQSTAVEPPINASTLYDAAVFGDFARVEELLKQDPAAVNQTDAYGFTALHGVVGEYYVDMAQLLIAKGADVNARNESGITPLHVAAYPEMAELLVAHGAALDARDAQGSTPLHVAAAEAEAIEVMEQLLQLGAKVNALDDDGHTALDIAQGREEDDKVELLREYGGRSGQLD